MSDTRCCSNNDPLGLCEKHRDALGNIKPDPTPMIRMAEPGPCTRKGCGKPLSEHEMGIFCP